MGLKSLRLKRGLTQRQLAEKIGTSRGFIGDYESGRKNIEKMEILTAIRLCDALRVSNPRKLLEPDDSSNQ